jgi:hypothetical protein
MVVESISIVLVHNILHGRVSRSGQAGSHPPMRVFFFRDIAITVANA